MRKSNYIDQLANILSKLPSIGPRSARRIVLHLLQEREGLFTPIMGLMETVNNNIQTCRKCGNFDVSDPCHICSDPKREEETICVVESVADIWAMERGHFFKGRYFVLGGLLSAIEGTTPEKLGFQKLYDQLKDSSVKEVILGLSATVEGQTTCHYLIDFIKPLNVRATVLAQGMPIGGELDYMDDGTIMAALRARKELA